MKTTPTFHKKIGVHKYGIGTLVQTCKMTCLICRAINPPKWEKINSAKPKKLPIGVSNTAVSIDVSLMCCSVAFKCGPMPDPG